jgi:hypothetical protein
MSSERGRRRDSAQLLAPLIGPKLEDLELEMHIDQSVIHSTRRAATVTPVVVAAIGGLALIGWACCTRTRSSITAHDLQALPACSHSSLGRVQRHGRHGTMVERRRYRCSICS